MVPAEVTPVDHRCDAFRSSGALRFGHPDRIITEDDNTFNGGVIVKYILKLEGSHSILK